jgi:hypothetical protein
VAYFAAVEKPFTVVLLLDTSASTWSKLSEIKEAERAPNLLAGTAKDAAGRRTLAHQHRRRRSTH